MVEAMRQAIAEMGRVDGAIANAGLMKNVGAFTNMDGESWHGLLAINLHGAFYTAREAARHMRQRAEGGDPCGSILFGASPSGTSTASSG